MILVWMYSSDLLYLTLIKEYHRIKLTCIAQVASNARDILRRVYRIFKVPFVGQRLCKDTTYFDTNLYNSTHVNMPYYLKICKYSRDSKPMQRLYSSIEKALRYYAMLRNFAKAACKRSSPVARPPTSQATRPPASSKVDPTNGTICRSLAIHDNICLRCKINIPPPAN